MMMTIRNKHFILLGISFLLIAGLLTGCGSAPDGTGEPVEITDPEVVENPDKQVEQPDAEDPSSKPEEEQSTGEETSTVPTEEADQEVPSDTDMTEDPDTPVSNPADQDGADEQDTKTYFGFVRSVQDGEVLVSIPEENSALTDQALVHIGDDTTFEEGISKDFVKGNRISFQITGEIMESYPVQVRATHILENSAMIPSEPEDPGIHLDPREKISGFFDGAFPHYLLDETKTELTTDINLAFAILLDENPSTGYHWTFTLPEGLELIGDQFEAEAQLPGAGGTHYYGLRALEKGEYFLTFKLVRPDGETEREVTFQIIAIDATQREGDTFNTLATFIGKGEDWIDLVLGDIAHRVYMPEADPLVAELEVGQAVEATLEIGEAGYTLVEIKETEMKHKLPGANTMIIEGTIQRMTETTITVLRLDRNITLQYDERAELPEHLTVGASVKIEAQRDMTGGNPWILSVTITDAK